MTYSITIHPTSLSISGFICVIKKLESVTSYYLYLPLPVINCYTFLDLSFPLEREIFYGWPQTLCIFRKHALHRHYTDNVSQQIVGSKCYLKRCQLKIIIWSFRVYFQGSACALMCPKIIFSLKFQVLPPTKFLYDRNILQKKIRQF